MSKTPKSIKELLRIKHDEIMELSVRYGIQRIRLFGSAAQGKETKESDIDFLVAFEPGRSLLDLIGFKQDMMELLERKVDVVSEKGVSPYLKDRIFKSATPL